MIEIGNFCGILVIKSSLIASRHGFSTRQGGKSTLPYTKSLNLARGRGDSDEIVSENLEIFANALGVNAKSIISVPQIHSGIVKKVDEHNAGEGTSREASFSCDGYVTDRNDLPLAVKTADCVPVLLEARNEQGKTIAVAAVHAGWRGTAERITENAVGEMIRLGADPKKIYAAIGPAIDVCCYEIKDDFAMSIREKLGRSYENEFIIQRNEKLFADLKGMNKRILLETGVPPQNIDICTECTCCNEELFYSHRRQNGIRGSLMNLICK